MANRGAQGASRAVKKSERVATKAAKAKAIRAARKHRTWRRDA